MVAVNDNHDNPGDLIMYILIQKRNPYSFSHCWRGIVHRWSVMADAVDEAARLTATGRYGPVVVREVEV